VNETLARRRGGPTFGMQAISFGPGGTGFQSAKKPLLSPAIAYGAVPSVRCRVPLIVKMTFVVPAGTFSQTILKPAKFAGQIVMPEVSTGPGAAFPAGCTRICGPVDGDMVIVIAVVVAVVAAVVAVVVAAVVVAVVVAVVATVVAAVVGAIVGAVVAAVVAAIVVVDEGDVEELIMLVIVVVAEVTVVVVGDGVTDAHPGNGVVGMNISVVLLSELPPCLLFPDAV
jgi:hypothetical protein